MIKASVGVSTDKSVLAIVAMLFFIRDSYSESKSPKPEIVYTKIADCKETVENENAAFSILDCGKVGSYTLSISQQSPIYFIVQLESSGTKLMTDFESLSGEVPLELGKALEWHLFDDVPRFLIFRLAWSTEQEPYAFNQHLVLNYVGKDVICPIATVNVKNNPGANQRVRDLLAEKYNAVTACPAAVEGY